MAGFMVICMAAQLMTGCSGGSSSGTQNSGKAGSGSQAEQSAQQNGADSQAKPGTPAQDGAGNSGSKENTANTGGAKAGAAGKASRTLQLGHVNPGTDTDHLQTCCTQFSEKLSELSGGAIQVTVVSDSQLGTDREMIEGMQMGTVDMTLCMNSSLGAFFPKLQAFDLPYLFENRNQVYGVFDDEELMGKLSDELYETSGVKVLGVADGGFRNVMNNIKPINSISDISGMKLRLPENAVWSSCFKAFGASPTTMAFSEVYTAVQQGTVDGFELPVASTYSGGYASIVKYYSLTEHLFTALDLCMAASTWESFSEEEQGWIQEAADYAVDYERDYIVSMEEQWLKGLAEDGMEVNEVADKQGFIDAARGIYQDFSGEIGQDLIDAVVEKVNSIK